MSKYDYYITNFDNTGSDIDNRNKTSDDNYGN